MSLEKKTILCPDCGIREISAGDRLCPDCLTQGRRPPRKWLDDGYPGGSPGFLTALWSIAILILMAGPAPAEVEFHSFSICGVDGPEVGRRVMTSAEDDLLVDGVDRVVEAPQIGLQGIEIALERLASGETEAAEAIFSEILERKRSEAETAIREAAEAARHLGALAALHDIDKALAYYRLATKLDPEEASGWRQLGHLLIRKRDEIQRRKAEIQSELHALTIGGSDHNDLKSSTGDDIFLVEVPPLEWWRTLTEAELQSMIRSSTAEAIGEATLVRCNAPELRIRPAIWEWRGDELRLWPVVEMGW